MSVLEEINKINNLFNKNKSSFWTSGKNRSNLSIIGYLFNTNIRTLESLLNIINNLKKVEGINRKDWQEQASGQKKFKHNIKSWEEYSLAFESDKGIFFMTKQCKNIIKEIEIIKNKFGKFGEKIFLILNFLTLNPSKKIPIINRINDLEKRLGSVEFNNFYYWIASFYKENKPIKKYKNSLYHNKYFILWNFYWFEDFCKEIINENLKNLDKTKQDILNVILDKKFEKGGIYANTTLRDEMLTFLLIVNLKRSATIFSAIQGISYLLELNLNLDNFVKYIENESILLDYGADLFDYLSEFKKEDLQSDEYKKFIANQEIKERNLKNKRKINVNDRSEFNKIKPWAKKVYEYKCYFEKEHKCTYFTSSTTDENYIEIHHLIPHSHSIDFDVSIEILENYLSLCPNCHKKIHYSIKSEKEQLIKQVFNERRAKLESKGIKIEINDLIQMYN